MTAEQKNTLNVDALRKMNRAFHGMVPLNNRLGVVIEKLDYGYAKTTLPYQESFIGDPKRVTIHGGVITTLLDTTAGMAAFMSLKELVPFATLDLRIDHLASASPGADIEAEAKLIRHTRSVIFIEATAFFKGNPNPISRATVTFMLGTPLAPDATRPNWEVPV